MAYDCSIIGGCAGDGGRPRGTTPRVFDNIPVTSAPGTPLEFLNGREATEL
jgi:hypothetical protein